MPSCQRKALYFEVDELDYFYLFLRNAPDFTKMLDDGRMMARASIANLREFRRRFPNDPVIDQDGSLARLDRVPAAIIPQPHKIVRDPDASPLCKHQLRALDTVIARDVFGFWHEQGTGKSCEIVTSAAELFLRGHIKQALVITNGRGLPQFLNEQIPLHQPMNVKFCAYQFKPATVLKAPSPNLLHMTVVGHGFFQSRRIKKKNKSTAPSANLIALRDWCKRAPTALFIDESQNFKGWTGLRVQNLDEILPHTQRRYLYSGEPKPNSLDDLFTQFFLMDPDILGHSTLTSFHNEFCIMGGYENNEVVDLKNQDRFAELVAPHCEYVALKDCHDMPPTHWHAPSKFEPTKEQTELYKQAREKFLVTVTGKQDNDDVQKVCAHAGSQLITLAQIANGFFRADPIIDPITKEKTLGPIHRINHERAYYTVDTLLGTSRKCIIFCRFHEDLESISIALKDFHVSYVEYSGRVEECSMEPNKQLFREDPSVRVFLSTTESGGESLNLQVANHTIYYSLSYNWGKFDQSWHRTWRLGQSEPCFYDIVAGFTIDHLILNNHREKRSTSDMLRDLVGLRRIAEMI